MEKNYRIRTNVSTDKVLNVNLQQDVDFLEILSIKLRQQDTYRIQTSNYGIIVGRVLANDSFGIENAKVSVFIPIDEIDSLDEDIEALYPYKSLNGLDGDTRYNTLPDYKVDRCHQPVGSFPNKRLVLDNDNVLEIYDKYWKYTTVTNASGDYMLFGVPVGSQQLHTDIDISDIGLLSQRPRDLIYKGYSVDQFANPSQFNKGSNLDSLPQIISQNDSVYVYPFWGDASNDTIAITRCDIKVDYKFESYCVFLGSIFTEGNEGSLGSNCWPQDKTGLNSKLSTTNGTIETIRKTLDGKTEELVLQGNELIDEDGVFCYQIPMNLDYVSMDEFGNIVPSGKISSGIPTRARVRFRFSINDTGDEDTGHHRAKFLVPNNPKLLESSVKPKFDGSTVENGLDSYYEFGDNTPDECYRDLLWNNVYSVKSYIPRIQRQNRPGTGRYTGIKGVFNHDNNNNPVPYNNISMSQPKAFRRLCREMDNVENFLNSINVSSGWWIFSDECAGFTLDEDYGYDDMIDTHNGQVIAPGCYDNDAKEKFIELLELSGCSHTYDKDRWDCVLWKKEPARDVVRFATMNEFDLYQMNFTNDWLNGSIYFPMWFWKKTTASKGFLGTGIFGHHSINQFCSCDGRAKKLYLGLTCSLDYMDENLTIHSDNVNKEKDSDYESWHRKKEMIRFKKGLIKRFQTSRGDDVYYYSPGVTTTEEGDMVRLFATDIVLLGSLNEDTNGGIPTVSDKLPSTTSQTVKLGPELMPYSGDTGEEFMDVENGLIHVTETSGLDYGFNPYQETDFFKYERGLFGNMGCSYVSTKQKTCINAERICELSVNPDSLISMDGAVSILDNNVRNGTKDYPNVRGSGPAHYTGLTTLRGYIRPDGMITSMEIEKHDTRTDFATMNHRKLVVKEGTHIYNPFGYDMYDLDYLYVNGFDGRLKLSTSLYATQRGVGKQITHNDIPCDDYITFRMGSRAYGRNNSTSHRHFYVTGKIKGIDYYSFPLYENSFYFYFGLHKGKTAIDKFYKSYFSPCNTDD